LTILKENVGKAWGSQYLHVLKLLSLSSHKGRLLPAPKIQPFLKTEVFETS